MLTSLLESNPRNSCVIHILTDGISRDDVVRFNKLSRHYDAQIEVTTIPQALIDDLPKRIGKWPRSICFRLLAPDLLPPDIERVIYLDCDITVDTDLMPLWETDLGGMPCGAVTEEEGPDSDLILNLSTIIPELYPMERYFNSGVLLMNLRMFRTKQLHAKALRYIKEIGNILQCPDQDALNIVLSQQCRPLSLKWNVQSRFFIKSYYEMLPSDKREEMRTIALRRISGIIHFTGEKHPWDKDALLFHPFWYLWYRALRRSPWHKSCPLIQPSSYRKALAIYKLKLLRRIGLSCPYDTIWIDTSVRGFASQG